MKLYRRFVYACFPVLGFIGGCLFTENGNSENVEALYQGRYEMERNLLLGNISLAYSYSNSALPNFSLTKRDGAVIPFSDLMDGGKKMVLKISSNNCSSCIEFCVDYLRTILKVVPSDRIVVVMGGNSKRELLAFTESLGLDVPICYVSGDVFQGVLVEENLPFFFISDSSLVMEDLFVPIKEIPDHAENYFSTICRKHFL